MKHLNQKNITSVLVFVLLALPTAAYGASLIPCEGTAADPCTFDHIVILINKVVQFLMFSVAVPLAAIGFMFMGAKLVLMQNKEAEMTKAKEGLWNIVIGFGIMLASYVVIKTALFAFLSDEQKTFMGFLFQ